MWIVYVVDDSVWSLQPHSLESTAGMASRQRQPTHHKHCNSFWVASFTEIVWNREIVSIYMKKCVTSFCSWLVGAAYWVPFPSDVLPKTATSCVPRSDRNTWNISVRFCLRIVPPVFVGRRRVGIVICGLNVHWRLRDSILASPHSVKLSETIWNSS